MTKMILYLSAAARQVPATAERVASFGARSGLNAQACFQVKTIVAEALNNIVCHGFVDAEVASIELHCGTAGDALAITIVDNGLSLSHLPDHRFPDGYAGNGRGWPIIFSWADSVEYQSMSDRNELTLTKRLS